MCGKQWGELPDDQDVGNRLISLVYMYMYTAYYYRATYLSYN